MFGLHSDLDHEKWDECCETPPADKKCWDGYQRFNLGKHAEKDGRITYFLSTMVGDPVQAVLYGHKRNPVKNVGHCYMNLVQRKEGNIITGIAVEDDWVKMKPSYLETFEEKSEQDKEAEMKLCAKVKDFDMGIYGDLDQTKWEKIKKEVPRIRSKLGYEYYDVCRVEQDGTTYHLFLCTAGGHQVKATLMHTLRNAFHAITKGYFKIEHNVVKGMMIEEDWVEMKC